MRAQCGTLASIRACRMAYTYAGRHAFVRFGVADGVCVRGMGRWRACWRRGVRMGAQGGTLAEQCTSCRCAVGGDGCDGYRGSGSMRWHVAA